MNDSNFWSESKFKRHDHYNFEIKVDYALQKEIKENKYAIDAYFFIPENLQVNRESYSKKQFFSDITIRSRFKTPKMTLQGINNLENVLSPLFKINNKLISIKNGSYDIIISDKIKYEMKLLGSMIKTNLRDQFNHFLKTNKNKLETECYFNQFLSYLQQIIIFQNNKDELKVDLANVQIPLEIREVFNLVDDFIGYQIIRRCTKALDFFSSNHYSCGNEENQLQESLIRIIRREKEYRKGFNTNLELKKDDDNESFAYWWGILKKFVQGVLYLNIKQKKEKSASLELFYSIAAGVAMFISIYFSLLIAEQYEQNSIPFIFALVIGYMIKDRVKDGIRRYSNKAIGIIFPDKKYDLIDSRFNKKLGHVKESMHFIRWSDIPEEIVNIRESSNKSVVERSGKPESIIKYKRVVNLLTEYIKAIHERSGDVNDIIRFNIKNFLQYADDPYASEIMYDLQSKEITREKYHKIYHINVILKLHEIERKEYSKAFYKKVRVIFDQEGIVKVEKPDFSI